MRTFLGLVVLSILMPALFHVSLVVESITAARQPSHARTLLRGASFRSTLCVADRKHGQRC